MLDPELARAGLAQLGKSNKAKPRRKNAAVDFYPQYRGNEAAFLKEVLGRRTATGKLGYTAPQREMIRSFFQDGRTHTRSGRKCGKSHVLADLALAQLYTRPSVVILISASWGQVRDGLFGNLRKAFQDSAQPLAGELGISRLTLGPRHYAVGASWQTPDRAQGAHSGVACPDDPDQDYSEDDLRKLLERAIEDGRASELAILCDESPGIDNRVFEALQGSFSGNTRVFLSGNPTIDAQSEHFFARLGLPGSRFHRISVSHLTQDEFPDPVAADVAYHKGYGEGGRWGLPNWIRDEQWVNDCIEQ